ncbi:MAG: PhnD/SsuA/transferrin family substrate-binding protein [Pseudomonadota bacterium]
MRFTLCAFIALFWFVAPAKAQITGGLPPSETAEPQDDERWREKLGRFRVGVVAGQRTALTARKLRPFRQSMAQALDMPVELIFFTSEPALMAAHRRGRVEYGVFSATGFAALNGLCKCAEALAAPATKAGLLGFQTVLLGADGVERLEQLRGQSVLIGADGDLARHWVVGFGLEEAGFSQQAQSWTMRLEPSPNRARKSLETGEAKAAFLVERFDMDRKPLWRSPLIRFGPHAVRKSLPADLKDRLSAWLADLYETAPRAYDAIEPHHGGGFQPATNGDYQWLEKALRFHRLLPVSHEAGVLSALRR